MKSKAQILRDLHVKGQPLILYNIWDAGTARAVADAGAPAVATGSWSVAEAQGYPDGQNLPLDDLLAISGRIAASVDIPVSVDFEGGYSEVPEAVTENVSRLAATGAAGLNFEDQIVGGDGLHALEQQVRRIRAVRDADAEIFLNARTDIFLKQKDAATHSGLVSAVIERGEAYREAGADCFFVPGTSDLDVIARVCDGVGLPVNVLHSGPPDGIAALAQAGVGRVSHGPNPYRWAMAWIKQQAQALL